MAEAESETAATDSNTMSTNREQFDSFFEHFMAELSRRLIDLRAAATSHPRPPATDLQKLVERVVAHYENYYMTKSLCSQRDVTLMFSPTWTSSTENLFMWAGGWRPSTAFHLLYSKSSIQLEAQQDEILKGLHTADLSNLSAVQLQAVYDLHRSTINTERAISEKLAVVQKEVAAKEMVVVAGTAGEGMEGEIQKKRDCKDQLRIDTIKGIVGKLEFFQAVHFLIAAAELHLAVHEYGKAKDDATVATEEQAAVPAD
ncbi:transcription factor-like protein [Rhynchospora pubera]|uniref:Transcription factor-like protein n=1 Tax=Rhynchospora pubera TaxID=906938 RepID=A0AAV8EQW0_9POAL|nr:transcription factor-like protein [Rhynchospora pubera]